MEQQLTRRSVAVLLTAAAAGFSQTPAPNFASAIHQEVDFGARPTRIYEILLDAKLFAAFSRQPAEIEPEAGGAFKLFGGRIEGRNVELVPNRRIVQAWRPKTWPAGDYSIVKMEFQPHGAGTRIVLDHGGFMADKWPSLNSGWTTNYWEPLHKYLKA